MGSPPDCICQASSQATEVMIAYLQSQMGNEAACCTARPGIMENGKLISGLSLTSFLLRAVVPNVDEDSLLSPAVFYLVSQACVLKACIKSLAKG